MSQSIITRRSGRPNPTRRPCDFDLPVDLLPRGGGFWLTKGTHCRKISSEDERWKQQLDLSGR